MPKASKARAEYVRAYGSVEEIGPHRIKPLARLVYSTQFELFIALVIACNAVSLATLTFSDLSPETIRVAEAIDAICFGIYAVELLIRMVSYGSKPWLFFTKGWNIFDFLLVALAPFFAGQTTVLRLLRLFRLIRIFRFLPEVRILSASILKSLPPLMSMTALIALLVFLYGMVGHYLFGKELEADWGSIGAAMMSLVILLTLENFPVYLEDAIAVNALAVPYLLSYVFIIVFTILNLLIGIVLNAMDEARAEAKKRSGDVNEIKLMIQELESILASGRVAKDDLVSLQTDLDRLRSYAKQS